MRKQADCAASPAKAGGGGGSGPPGAAGENRGLGGYSFSTEPLP